MAKESASTAETKRAVRKSTPSSSPTPVVSVSSSAKVVSEAKSNPITETKPVASPATIIPASPPPPPLAATEVAPAQTGSAVAVAASGDHPEGKVVSIKGPIVVNELAKLLNIKHFQLIHHLMELNIFAAPTQVLEEEQAKKVCTKLGYTFHTEKRDRAAHSPIVPKPKEKEIATAAIDQDLKPRPPVVTIMGHVDHGKTSLLDAIRKTRVAAGEAGGITQHIGAYQVKRGEQLITFVDTPGHAAFTAMRARGASVTDIVVLVVAADDGLMPQTIESITHARAAKVPVIVAINKIDLPAANAMKIKGQLQDPNIGLTPEEYGGETICVEVSATKEYGIDKLLENILLQAEILELKAKYTGLARARVVESQTEVGRGPTATVLIQSGTLKVGDGILCGSFYGRVKALVNDLGQNVKEASPSTPVKVIGLSGVPSPGDELEAKKSDKEARDIAESRTQEARLQKIDVSPKVTLENLFSTIADGQKKVLNIILKGDVQGSVEAIANQLKKIESKKVDLAIISTAVGPISESDILLAKASSAVVVGFNTKTDNSAANAAKRENVQIKLYSIIYELIDQIKDAMAGLLDPELRESVIGTALVKKVFALSKFPVAGCMVQSGRISRNGRARVLRRKQPIYDGGIQTLKRFQDDASEVRSGMECGIRLGDFTEYEEGDIIECYLHEKVPQAL